MTPQNEEFLKSLISGAQLANKKFGVPASVSMAQAILESTWGRSGLAKKGFNLFGIKADSSWKGPSVTMPTTEYIHGIKTKVNALFRKYDSFSESLEDHGSFLMRNKRYKPAFEHTDGCEFCREIAKAGYATDPNYASLLISLIKQYNLKQYDVIV